jgi:hypothetical protein
MTQILTSRLDKQAFTAKNPQFFPIILTIPTPYSAASASTLAAVINGIDSAIAVSNPKDLSTKGMSLSILDGMPIT